MPQWDFTGGIIHNSIRCALINRAKHSRMSIIYRYILDLYLSHMFALYIPSTNHVLPDIHDGYQSNLVRQAGVLVFPPLINCQTREQNVHSQSRPNHIFRVPQRSESSNFLTAFPIKTNYSQVYGHE